MASFEIEVTIDEFTDPQIHAGHSHADIELRDSRSADRIRLIGTPEALLVLIEELFTTRHVLLKAIQRREVADCV
jgi:hypothetical protein